MSEPRARGKIEIGLLFCAIVGALGSRIIVSWDLAGPRVWLTMLILSLIVAVGLGIREERQRRLLEAQKPSFEEWLAEKKRSKPKRYDKDESDGPIIDV